MKKFDVFDKTPIFTFVKIHKELRIKKLERFDVYKKLRVFTLLKRSREKLKLIRARSSRTTQCAFCIKIE